MWPKFSSTASCRRRPQASKTARSARSRFSFKLSPPGTCHSLCDCSAVSQFPSLTPIFLTPFTRRIPAARSGLRSPQSAASYAKRRTAPQAKIDCPWSEISGFEMNSIAEHNGPAEREPRLRAIPLHEFFNRVPVTALRVCRGQAAQNGGFCLIQIW